MPTKKFQFPKEYDFETACLLFSAVNELGIVEYDALWKPSIARLRREKIFTVELFNNVSNEKLMLNWSMPQYLVLEMRRLLQEGWTQTGEWLPKEA